MELNERIHMLMDWLFGFDLKRTNEVAIEVAEEMKVMNPCIDWDCIDSTEFTDIALKALDEVMVRSPGLFL